MAINPTPEPVLCADIWRHDQRPPPATALVRQHGRSSFTPRCDPCIRAYAASPSAAILVDVYDLGPARTTAHYDADTAAPV